MKKDFLIGQALVNSIGAAFQHAGVYVKGLSDMDARKTSLRKDLMDRLLALGKKYAKVVTESKHCENIQSLANELTNTHRDLGILRNSRFRIGIVQKAINLYLKYLWCLGDIPTPPHCPIDRRIIDALGIPWKERGSYDWTKLDDIKKYKKLIKKCKEQARNKQKHSVAEWELEEWEP